MAQGAALKRSSFAGRVSEGDQTFYFSWDSSVLNTSPQCLAGLVKLMLLSCLPKPVSTNGTEAVISSYRLHHLPPPALQHTQLKLVWRWGKHSIPFWELESIVTVGWAQRIPCVKYRGGVLGSLSPEIGSPHLWKPKHTKYSVFYDTCCPSYPVPATPSNEHLSRPKNPGNGAHVQLWVCQHHLQPMLGNTTMKQWIHSTSNHR